MNKFSSYRSWICSSRMAFWMRSPTATSASRRGREGDVSGLRFDDCRVRDGFFHDCCTSLSKKDFPVWGFTVRMTPSQAISEQVHCHPYQPLTTIAFIFTQNDYNINPQGFWPATSDTVVAYIQDQRFQRTFRAFGSSGRSSEWS